MARESLTNGSVKGSPTRTDYNKWRCLEENGRTTWHYLTTDEDVEEWPQTTADKYFLGIPTVRAY